MWRRSFVEAQVFEVDDGVVEVSVREKKLYTASLKLLSKESEADDIDKEKNFPEQERKKRDVCDGGFFSGFKRFFAFEKSADFVCQRKLNRMKHGNAAPVSFKAIFEKCELRGFSRSVYAGKGDEFHVTCR